MNHAPLTKRNIPAAPKTIASPGTEVDKRPRKLTGAIRIRYGDLEAPSDAKAESWLKGPVVEHIELAPRSSEQGGFAVRADRDGD